MAQPTRSSRRHDDERAALENAVLEHHPRLQDLALRLTGDPDEAREIGQLAWIRAREAVSGFRGEARLGTWLYRVVLNLCRDRVRKRRAYADRVALIEPPAPEQETGTRPTERAAGREASEVVADAVRSLPEGEREVVLLRHYHDLTFPEISAVLGEPVTTVKSRLTKGLRRLRKELEDLET